jgi:hypothetical protein
MRNGCCLLWPRPFLSYRPALMSYWALGLRGAEPAR